MPLLVTIMSSAYCPELKHGQVRH